jgi:hypothetical protein
MKTIYFYFIPRTDAELLRWLINFIAQIDTYGATLGLTPAQITDLKDQAQAGVEALQNVIIKKREYNDAVLFKNLVRDREVGFIANTAVVLKRNPLFTDNIGGALGILNAKVDQNKLTLQPEINVNSYPGYVEIAFNKRGQSGVVIFSRLQGTEEWTELKMAVRSPYKDTRPLAVANKAEMREYIARCVNDDEFVGQNSEIGVAVFGG